MEWKVCVQKMIDYIEKHLKEDILLEDVAAQVGYSKFYCSKAFHIEAGMSMKEFIRLRRISAAALQLRDTRRRILDIALDFGYNSQEAFTRAFTDAFDITPGAYRKRKNPIPLFLERNINHQHIKKGDDCSMQEEMMKDVKITFLAKPERKMLVMHREGANDYHELCETEGAEKMWGTLVSMQGTLGGVICGWLNENGETRYVWGVEVPLDYNGPIPEGLETVIASACDYVKFCHPPYKEEMHEAVTEAVWNVSELWNPKDHGWEWYDEVNPVYEDDTEAEGYMVLKPVKKLIDRHHFSFHGFSPITELPAWD